MWSLRNKTNEKSKGDKQTPNVKNKLVVARREVGQGMDEIDKGDYEYLMSTDIYNC